EDEPVFKGENTYSVTFAVDGARVSTVKKRILELFPSSKGTLKVDNSYRKVSRSEQLGEAQSILEELLDGLRDCRENLPENFQDGETADRLDECIEALESIIGDMGSIEFPSAFGG